MYASATQAPIETKNPRVNLLVTKWQHVWLLALDRRRKLNDAMDRLEEVITHSGFTQNPLSVFLQPCLISAFMFHVQLKEFANFDFDVWRKRYMRWMNHKKSRVMDFFRRIDKDQDGKVTRQEFIEGILSSSKCPTYRLTTEQRVPQPAKNAHFLTLNDSLTEFPTSRLEMSAVADIFDRDGDGYIDYYEFVAALHPNKDAYKPLTDADKIEDEVIRTLMPRISKSREMFREMWSNNLFFSVCRLHVR